MIWQPFWFLRSALITSNNSYDSLTLESINKKAYYTKEGVMDFLNKHVVSYDQEEVALYFAKLGKTA